MLSINKILKVTEELDLEREKEYSRCLSFYPDFYKGIANGVGSETSWTYHLTPDTIWLLDISPSANIHDWDFTFPYYFSSYQEGMDWFHLSNKRFHDNMEKQIKDGFFLVRDIRRVRKEEYYLIVNYSATSHNAFWSNKTLPSDWKKYCNYIPDFNVKKYELNKQIYSAVTGREVMV
jgi:hypothetical protein